MTIRAGDKFEELEGEIISVGETRKVQSRSGRDHKVATVKFKNEKTGLIDLTLWDENIVKVRPGDKVSIKQIEVQEYRGNLSLSIAPSRLGGSMELVK